MLLGQVCNGRTLDVRDVRRWLHFHSRRCDSTGVLVSGLQWCRACACRRRPRRPATRPIDTLCQYYGPLRMGSFTRCSAEYRDRVVKKRTDIFRLGVVRSCVVTGNYLV